MIFSNNIYRHIKHVGLSIAPNALRLINTDKLGKIKQQSEIQNPQPYFSGDIVDHSVLTEGLKTLIKQGNSTVSYAAICIPEKLAYSREHILPKLPTQEIAEAIRWQLTTIFPLNPNDIYYDWKLLFQSDKETKVVVTAVNKGLLDGILDACHEANIKPISIESSASALARAIKTLPAQAIITEIDGFGSSSTLIEGGVSTLTATTSFKTASGSEAVIQDIVISINQLLSRIHPPESNESISRIYITGEKSSPQLAEILSGKIGQKVTELNLEQIPAIYHTAYVESLTNVESPESEKTINLLPEHLQQFYRSEAELTHAKKTTFTGSVIGAIASLIAFGVFLTISIMNQQANAKLSAIAAPPNPPSDINISTIMQKAQKITALQPIKQQPIKSLTEAITIVEKLSLRQFDYSTATKSIKVSLAGIGRASLFETKDLFETSGNFLPVAIPLSALGSEEAEAVSLTIQINEK